MYWLSWGGGGAEAGEGAAEADFGLVAGFESGSAVGVNSLPKREKNMLGR